MMLIKVACTDLTMQPLIADFFLNWQKIPEGFFINRKAIRQ
jgi:hypothetical protein